MSWSWEAGNWKKSTKLLLLLATIWPIVYMAVFMGVVISLVLISERHRNRCGEIDVLQLDKKIRDGEIKRLSVGSGKIVAHDTKDCKYELFTRNDRTRDEFLRNARETVNGKPRVDEIDVNTSESADLPEPFSTIAPVVFLLVFVVHMGTILLMIAEMPFYIVLAVKNAHLQDTIRIVWIVLFAVVSIFASPVYWYVYIWRKQKDSPIDLDGPSLGPNRPASI